MSELTLTDGEVVEIAEKILENYNVLDIARNVDDTILDYVDEDWEDDGEYDTEFDWYCDFGRNEAEDQVINELVNEYEQDNSVEFDVNSFVAVGKYIAEKAGINY